MTLQNSRNGLLKHPVSRRIGDHGAAEIFMDAPLALARRSSRSMLPLRVALDDDDLHACHDRACRVRAMRRLRDQADFAMPLAPALVILANDE